MDFYTLNAQALIAQYQSLNPEQVHSAWLKYLPEIKPNTSDSAHYHALDIGAGAGRDTHWLAQKGWQVNAIEPNDSLRQSIPKHANINTHSDTLPLLSTIADKPTYQLILVSAVWMHLTPLQQAQSLQRLESLLSPQGLLVITWRNQAYEKSRQFETVDESLFHELPNTEAQIISSEDEGGREGVVWKCAVLQSKDVNSAEKSV